jgi:hypothetical protein
VTTKRLRAILAILTVAIPVAAAGLIGLPGTANAATQVKVLQLNICNSGVAGCYTGRALAKAVSVVTSVKPQVLSVNEACSGDLAPLQQALGPSRAVFVAAQRRDGAPVTCVNGQQFGNILIVAEPFAGPASVTGRYSAQDASNEMRVWACIPAGQVSACTTHLSASSGSTALAQCKELMARAVGYARPTVVAGDMNLRYQGSPNVQDCNPSGFYRKGDGSVQHIFASTGLAFVSGTKIDMAGTTDHPGWLVTTNKD